MDVMEGWPDYHHNHDDVNYDIIEIEEAPANNNEDVPDENDDYIERHLNPPQYDDNYDSKGNLIQCNEISSTTSDSAESSNSLPGNNQNGVPVSIYRHEQFQLHQDVRGHEWLQRQHRIEQQQIQHQLQELQQQRLQRLQQQQIAEQQQI